MFPYLSNPYLSNFKNVVDISGILCVSMCVQLSPGRGWQRRAEEDLEEESDGEGALVPLLGAKPLGG
jgi:hypothetical protein